MEYYNKFDDMFAELNTSNNKNVASKKIFIPAVGTLGDLQPLLVLAKELKQRGHIVWLGVHKRLEILVQSSGIDTVEIGGDMAIALSKTQEGIELQRNPSLFKMGLVKKIFRPLIKEWLEGIVAGVKDADLIVLSTCTVIVGLSCVEKFPNLKAVGVYIYPVAKTSCFAPPCLEGGSQSIFKWINSLKWKISEWVIYNIFQDVLNQYRANINLPVMKFDYYEISRSIFPKPMIAATIYSNYLLSRPEDWEENNHMVGPIFEKEDANFEPPSFITEFLTKWKNERIIYIGIGSMMAVMFGVDEQTQFLANIQTALAYNNSKAIISLVGYDEEGNNQLSNIDSILYLKQNIPHWWLFRHISAAIHHGGAGTTHACLRYGLPALIIPFMADQPFNGDRVFIHKAGPRPIPIRQINAQNLTESIHDLIIEHYDLYSMNAKEISQLMKNENGLDACISIIENELLS